MKTRKELASLTCVPCRGGIPPLEAQKVKLMLDVIPGWKKVENSVDKITKTYKFKDFSKSMEFVNKVAEIAEQENHHPDIFIHWNEVTITAWTHAINGLFDNDFIVAAKIDELHS
ncbi:4a-hydroxytetrahydrobiopterin dehydratase [Candidatus Thorarchaeota archaeon]|nr:MAG: 4a-hydroxytetrahydrobiopterin dehydratase [Candidatus Thorarchaeota archaeon]